VHDLVETPLVSEACEHDDEHRCGDVLAEDAFFMREMMLIIIWIQKKVDIDL